MCYSFFSLVLFFFFISCVLAQLPPFFGFNSFNNSQISLYGDAKFDGSFIQITQPCNFSAGRLMSTKPIKGFRNHSFGTYFSFSLSSQTGVGDGLVFVMLSNGFSSAGYNGKLFGLSNEIIQKKNRAFFAVEFDTKTDTHFGDLNNNHVGIDVGSLISVKVANASQGLNSGQILQTWIDYEASSKRIEVRMSKIGERRPVSPILSYPIDLSDMFKSEQVFIGLSSSNANSTQVCKLYSWSFKLRQVPYWMHSQPLDPQALALSKDAKPVTTTTTTTTPHRSDCAFKVLTALIIGTACGALGAYMVMFVWSLFVTKQPVAPEDFVVYDSDKLKVVAFDTSHHVTM